MDFKIVWSDAAIADLQGLALMSPRMTRRQPFGSGGAYSTTFAFWRLFHLLVLATHAA